MTDSLTAKCNLNHMKQAVKFMVDKENWSAIEEGVLSEAENNAKTGRTPTRFLDALTNIIQNSTSERQQVILTGLSAIKDTHLSAFNTDQAAPEQSNTQDFDL